MSSTLEQDVRIRFLLGELDQEEQREIEERYFCDDRYFDELLKLEEDLIGQEVQARPIDISTMRTRNGASLTKIERLPEIEFTKQWLADVRELIGSLNSQEGSTGSKEAVSEDRADAVLVSALIDFYEAKLRQADFALKQEEAERLLGAAWRDSELASALMENDGLGLHLLTTLDSGLQLKASALAATVGTHIDVIAPVLIRIVEFGGIKVEDELFSIAKRGSDVIKHLEISTVSSL